MSSILSTDDGRQNKNKNRYTARKKKLKHNTGKKTKSSSFFVWMIQMNASTTSVKETKLYSQTQKKKKCLGKWETNKKKKKKKKKLVYCCLESPLADD